MGGFFSCLFAPQPSCVRVQYHEIFGNLEQNKKIWKKKSILKFPAYNFYKKLSFEKNDENLCTIKRHCEKRLQKLSVSKLLCVEKSWGVHKESSTI
jgi:hypothetical protein